MTKGGTWEVDLTLRAISRTNDSRTLTCGHRHLGPLKKKGRVIEKMTADYGGDPHCVVDIVRASAIFVTMMQLVLAIEALLGDGCELVVVRWQISRCLARRSVWKLRPQQKNNWHLSWPSRSSKSKT